MDKKEQTYGNVPLILNARTCDQFSYICYKITRA
uniref:Uncharacterized protein n=1 Tax=Rhizophora mucronata TaxID=61149 RepID=A0A2P2NQ87_RHIMU